MAFRNSYRPGQGFTLGPIGFLVIANFIIFVATFIRPEFTGYLALNRSFIASQPWTILTSMFVHNGFFHIFFNMYTLYFFGTFLIRMLGEKVFFIVYFVGGMAGGVLFLLLSSSWAIGASGAVFAVVGAVVVLRPRTQVRLMFIPVPIPLWGAVIGFVLLSFLPSIAWQAHLGGLTFGALVGYYYRRKPIVYL